MDGKITGRCICGAVRYECSTSPEFSIMCQCRQCQHITGAGHTAQFAANTATTCVEGELSFFELTSDDGNQVNSAFCGTCGNPVYKTTSMLPKLILFHAATLDDPSSYKPQMVVFSKHGQTWDHIDPDIPRKD